MLRFIRKYITSFFTVAVIFGLTIPFFLPLSYTLIYFLYILAGAYTAVLLLYKPKYTSVYLFIIVICTGLVVGSVRGYQVHQNEQYQLKTYYDKKISLEGTVSEYPDVRIGYTYLTLSKIVIASSSNKISEKILVKAPLYPEYKYGDRLEVSGKLYQPQEIYSTSTESRFSYPKYLAVNDIYSTIPYPHIEKISEGKLSLIGVLYSFKDRCIEIVTKYIPEPAAGLLVGILFGIKKALPDDVLQIFITAGVVHIIVLSGYNIAIVVEATTKVFSNIPRRARYLLSYIAVCIFVLFVGASSTAIRAGVMACIALFAKEVGRESTALQVLLLASAGIGLYQPKLLLYDTSFQLSFLATLGLIVFTPKLIQVSSKIPEKFGFREIVASTLATQITVVPYLLYSMGKTSVIGIISNVVIVPLIPIIMLLGCITICTGLIYQIFSIPFAYATYALLLVVISVATLFASVPFASINISISLGLLLVIYIVEFVLGSLLLSGRSLNK